MIIYEFFSIQKNSVLVREFCWILSVFFLIIHRRNINICFIYQFYSDDGKLVNNKYSMTFFFINIILF